ncbi:MAG: hypothetical protein ACJAUL_003606 [Paraglaciecola sp.]|jgi:hypothetical protein
MPTRTMTHQPTKTQKLIDSEIVPDNFFWPESKGDHCFFSFTLDNLTLGE